ncbi:MAG: hypothetical protein GEEBNDBF_01459 [bacterium]|nr:hypothetical protein [bacterium]
MRTVAWWLAGSLALVALGCSGGGSTPIMPSTAGTSPDGTHPVTSASAALGTPTQSGMLHQSALAIYTVDVDPASLTATSRLKETRTGQANDDLYLLSIDSFLTAGSFKITGVAATATTVDLAYAVAHPFPAPNNPTGTPNGSTNRADLGVAGMVLFLADVPSATGNTYFTDRVANTDLVANADAYYSPGGLLTTSGTANTYPYKQLVDETLDPRSGVSNGGDVTGNFGSDGWTRSEFGAGNNGWTGYGVMHQGQTVSNTVSFDKSALSGGFSLDVSIIAVYNDPRGGATAAQKKANRLPPASPDASLFAYRMPHGALDVGKISVLPESAGFIANTISAQTLSFFVEDWDARATESAETDLANDASFTNVAQGESGTPTLDVCIPGVLGDATVTADASTVVDDDSGVGGDVDQDSGRPGDALYYSTLVTKAAGSGQTAGAYTGMVRATDPQTGLTIGLNESLAPLPSTPDPVTYQAFTVELLPDNAPPSATVVVTTPNVADGGSVSISINGLADIDDDPIDILVDWDDDGTYTLATTVNSPYAGVIPLSSPITYTHNPPAPDIRDLPVRLDDGTAQVDIAPTPTFEVDAPASCPAYAAAGGTPVTGAFTYAGATNTTGTFWGWADIAMFSSNNAWSDDFVVPTTPGSSGPFSISRYSSAGVLDPTPIATIASPTQVGMTTQVEIDSNDRIVWSWRSTASGTDVWSPATRYGTGASVNVGWVTYTGGATVSAFEGTFTAPSPIVAMSLDQLGNLYLIGQDNILRRYDRTAGGYTAEIVTAPYPMDLKNAPYNLGPTTTWRVQDFAIDFASKAFFILAQSNLVVPNGRLLRIECDGTVSATLSGNPNPAVINLNTSTTFSIPADIWIDQRDASGGVLASQGQQQIVVGSNNTSAGQPDLRYFNSDLSNYASGPDLSGTLFNMGQLVCVNRQNILLTKGTSGYTNSARFTTPPTGWQ